MPSENKIKNNFLKVLCENVKNPFLVLDKSGNIISYNGEASNLFSFKNENQNIFDIVEPATSEKLKAVIDELFLAEEVSLIKEIDFELNNGTKFHTSLIVNTADYEEQQFIFLNFVIEPKQIKIERVTDLSIGSKNFEELICNKTIHEIFKAVISFYPFTFVGKEMIRRKVDELEEYFWIKDTNGVFILINEKLAGGLGLNHVQIEGKPENTFMAPYITEFFNSIENYVKETSSSVTIGGVPFKDFFSGDDYQTVQFPITDIENKVIGIIGVSQKITQLGSKLGCDESISGELRFVKKLPKAVAFIDNNGKIKHSSDEFCKLFSKESKDFDGINFDTLFPINLADKVKNFLNSPKESEKIKLSGTVNAKIDFPQGSYLSITRIFDTENNSIGISLLIDEAGTGEDLQKIFSSRGRMFEVLIQNNPEPIFIYDKENLRFLEVNNAALELYGYTRNEFLQMDLTDLYSPDDIQTLLDSKTGPQEGKFLGPYRHKKKNGDTVLVELNKASLKFNDRNADFINVRDVTARMENDKKNQLFKAAFDNTDDLLFVTDESGFITFINFPVISVLGYSKDDLEKTSFAALVKDQERSTISTTIFQSYFKETVSLEMELKKSDGEYLQSEITATPVLDFNGEVDSFLILGKVKHVEKEEQPPKELIKEVVKEVIVEKPVPVSNGKGSLTDLSFFSNVFHEILTPINVILGFVQELTESIENPTSEQKEASDIINQNRNNLLSIMNSVIEYSQIQENAVDIKPQQISITEIIDQLQIDSKDAVGTSDIEFAYGKISSSLKFESDKQKFLRLSALLFKVAAKLSKQKKIYFSAIPYDQDRFMVSFKDNYSNTSDELCSSFESYFKYDENYNAKHFGISRLTTHLVKALLNLLNGRYQNIESLKPGIDCGFIFPLSFAKPLTVHDQMPEFKQEFKEVAEKKQFEKEPPVEERFNHVQPDEEIKSETDVKNEKSYEPVKEEQPYKTDNGLVFEEKDLEVKPEERVEEELNHVEEFEDISIEEDSSEDYIEGKIEYGNAESKKHEEESNEEKIEPDKQVNFEEKNHEEKAAEEKVEESKPAEEKFEKEQIEEKEITPLESTEEKETAKPDFVEEKKYEKPFTPARIHPDFSQLSCLYIEDQIDSQILFKVQMKELRDVKFAVSFEETLPILDQQHFDFIVIDINLQGEYNGLDALKIIHRMPEYENIPIIAVTAYVLPGDKEKFIAAGFHDFIAKPIFREKMIEALDKIFVTNS